jgi:hypothetical protein
VGARRFDLLLLRLGAVDALALLAVEAALPGHRRFGVVRERHLEVVALGAAVGEGAAGGEVVVTVGLVADGSEATPTEDAVGHECCPFLDCMCAVPGTHSRDDAQVPTPEDAGSFPRHPSDTWS